MGEHKIPKPIPVRPDLAIMRLKAAVGTASFHEMDEDTKSFMDDLARIMGWIDHLEKDSGELSVPQKLDA